MSTTSGPPASVKIDPTAAAVGIGLVLAGKNPALSFLLPDEYVDLAERALRASSSARLASLTRSRLGRIALTALMHRINPGIIPEYVARKALLASFATTAVEQGIGQVLLLGSGFDALGLRLARRYPGLQVIEVDSEPVLACKREALRQLGGAPPNLVSESLDLATPTWHEALLARGLIASGKPLLTIIEGVTMYLPPASVASLFATLGTLAGGHAQIAFTFLDLDLEREPVPGGARRWLAKRGAPLSWAMPRTRMPDWLAERGYAVQSLSTAAETGRRAGLPARQQTLIARQIECVCVAMQRQTESKRTQQ